MTAHETRVAVIAVVVVTVGIRSVGVERIVEAVSEAAGEEAVVTEAAVREPTMESTAVETTAMEATMEAAEVPAAAMEATAAMPTAATRQSRCCRHADREQRRSHKGDNLLRQHLTLHSKTPAAGCGFLHGWDSAAAAATSAPRLDVAVVRICFTVALLLVLKSAGAIGGGASVTIPRTNVRGFVAVPAHLKTYA